jgi:hypothetical protein
MITGGLTSHVSEHLSTTSCVENFLEWDFWLFFTRYAGALQVNLAIGLLN